MPVGQGCNRIQPLVHGPVFGIYQVYTGIYLVYSWNDSSFSVPATNPFSSRFGCPSHWHIFGEWNVDLGEWDPALLHNTSHWVECTRRIYYVYAGIYLVYTKDWTVDKRLDPVATLAHWHFIVSRPYVWGYPLHLPVSPPWFAGIYTL